MKEFYYVNDEEESVTYDIDGTKQDELNDTLFQYLRDSGVSKSEDVTADHTGEQLAIELVERLVELLEIETIEEE